MIWFFCGTAYEDCLGISDSMECSSCLVPGLFLCTAGKAIKLLMLTNRSAFFNLMLSKHIRLQLPVAVLVGGNGNCVPVYLEVTRLGKATAKA